MRRRESKLDLTRLGGHDMSDVVALIDAAEVKAIDRRRGQALLSQGSN